MFCFPKFSLWPLKLSPDVFMGALTFALIILDFLCTRFVINQMMKSMGDDEDDDVAPTISNYMCSLFSSRFFFQHLPAAVGRRERMGKKPAAKKKNAGKPILFSTTIGRKHSAGKFDKSVWSVLTQGKTTFQT